MLFGMEKKVLPQCLTLGMFLTAGMSMRAQWTMLVSSMRVTLCTVRWLLGRE